MEEIIWFTTRKGIVWCTGCERQFDNIFSMINLHFVLSSNSISRYLGKNARLYIKMFIAKVFIRTIYWKQSKCQTINYWLNKFCILDYYTAINKTKGRCTYCMYWHGKYPRCIFSGKKWQNRIFNMNPTLYSWIMV